MFKLLYQSIVAAILAADTSNALILLNDGHHALMDPLDGPVFHAEMLYYAIKKANVEVIQYLLNLSVGSDLSFFHYCGHTPLSLVLEEGLNDMVPAVISKTDKNFALHMAVNAKDNKLIDLLLSKCVFKERLLHYLGLK